LAGFLNARCATEGEWIGDGEDLRHHFDAALEGFFQQFLLGRDEVVVADCVIEAAQELTAGDGFLQEAEDAAIVDGACGRHFVCLTGKHDPNGVRCEILGFGEKGDAVHAGHFKIGHNDGKGAVLFDKKQGIGTGSGGVQVEIFTKQATKAVEHVGFIIDTKDSGFDMHSGCVGKWVESSW
jgi:hypothetical protein